MDINSTYKVYSRRWLVLALFCLASGSNGWQWQEFTIIAGIIEKYYGVTGQIVDWTSIVFMVCYVPTVLPAALILDKWGLRVVGILGSFGTALGSWIKVFSISQDMFMVTLFGQAIVATSQMFLISIPARLAAVWFGPNQVSTACSLGVFGNQVGIALSFLFTPMMVKEFDSPEVIANNIRNMSYGIAGFTTAVFLGTIIYYPASPPSPPSAAQRQNEQPSTVAEFMASNKRLFLNKSYLLLLVSYGINIGVFNAVSTYTNRLILLYFTDKGSDEFAGRIGLVVVMSGVVGSVIGGIILDKYHRFKLTSVCMYFLSWSMLITFTFILGVRSQVLVYVVSIVLGFFMTGYIAVGYEFGVELTYPEPEFTTAGLLMASSQVFGFLLTLAYGYLFEVVGDIWTNVTMSGIHFLGVVITCVIGNEQRRQAVLQSSHKSPEPVAVSTVFNSKTALIPSPS